MSETERSKPVITVKDLYKVYRIGENRVRALNGVSFSINRGEFCAIVGTSGSGKTTLLNCISTIDTVSAGQEIAVRDLERIQELGKDTVIIQVFTNIDDRIVKAETGQMVKAGEKIAVTIE